MPSFKKLGALTTFFALLQLDRHIRNIPHTANSSNSVQYARFIVGHKIDP